MNTKRSISFNVAAILLALLLTASVSTAQSVSFPIREMSNKLYGSSLTPGTNIVTVANDQRAIMLANPSTFPANVKYKANHTLVKLCVDHAATTVPSAAYIYKMAYTIDGATSMTSSALTFSTSDTMVIAYNPDSLTAYQDMQVKTYPQLYDAKVTITGFYDMTSGTPVALPMPPPNKNFFIELAMQYQPYLMTHSLPGDMSLNTSKVYTSGTQVLTVSWTPNTAPLFLGRVTPAMYELEWTYADSYAPDGTELAASAVTYNFKNNATRIITDSLSYGIPVVYPRGYIVYRVRMVRMDNTNYKYPIYGVWSLSAASGTVSSATAAKYYRITAPHSSDELNWNYTIHFAEGGKYKHVLGYFDGLLKNRQTITRFNTNPGKLLATENIYDFEGRPAITTLPTVIDATGFAYQSNMSLSQLTTKAYSPYDFDLKPTTCPDEPTIPRFTNGSRTNRYYSKLNTDTVGMQKFVPQAEGFPFVHTQLSPGYADRVDKMGGAGIALQVNKGHDTRHEYMQGDQPDLNNLFGINAGYASFYNKTVSKDPNGQNSMSVKDYKGRQILTSLIGASVDTTQIAMIFNDEVPAASKARENKLADSSANIIVGSEKKYNGSFYMDFDAMSNIKYEYDFKPFMVCPAPGFLGLTVKCNYEYDLHDNCGIEVLHKTGVLGITGVSTIASPPPFAEDTNILLNKGKYTIRKTLTIADGDVEAAVDSFFNHTPNCLKTEDDFIREQVEKTTYPCPAIDPCGELKRQMMEELFTNKKYGKWYPGTPSIPVFGDGNSIYDIPQVMPDGSEPKYRFQNNCVFAALDSIVIQKYGKTYKHIAGPVMEVTDRGVKKLYDTKADIVTIFKNEIYTGKDQYTIAEALLPLHPEYCKLLACYDDTLAKRLKALPDAATAIKYNMFYLDSIVRKDADLRNRMALPPFNYAHFDDSLRTLLGGRVRMDTLASQMAFCMNMDADVFGSAKDFFRNDIISLNFPNARIKDLYFVNQRNMYLANREKYLSMSMTSAGNDCPPCDSFARMKLKPEPVITALYGADGSYASGPDGIMSLFSDTTFAKIKAWLDKTKDMPADTAGVAAMGDSATTIVYRADSVLCSIAADSIVAKLANCFGAGASTARLKDSLIALVRRKEVKNGLFFPDQVRRAILTSGLSLNDLCHPYLVSYDYYDESFGGRGNCNTPSFYTAAAEFFNEPTINTPIKDASTAFNVTTPSWPATNFFAMKVDAGLSGGSGSIKMAAQYRADDSIYTISFFKTGSDTVQVSFRSPKVIRRGTAKIPFLAVPASDSIIFKKMTCLFDDPTVSAEGHVGRFMFNAEIERVETMGSTLEIQTGKFLGWNNGKVVMNEDGGNPLSAYVPCTQFRELFTAFKDSMTFYGGFAQDHPLFYRSMRNFMNYNLKKILSIDQYTRFLNSCALSDSMRIPMYGGYARISFPSASYADFEAFTEGIALSDTISMVSVVDYKNGSTQTAIIDYRMVPYKKMKQFNDRLLTEGGQLKAAPSGIAGRLWLPAGTAPAGFVSGTAFTLSAATSMTLRLSPYLPGWDNYDSYDVLATAPTPLELASGIQKIQGRIDDLGLDGFWLPNSYAATNIDYLKNKKQAYLRYVYSMQGLPASRVLDSLQAFFVRQQVAAFNATDVSYRNPENAYRFTDLYYTDSSSRFPGYDTVVKVLNYAKTVLGGNKIFMPIGTNKIKVFGDTGSSRNLNLYRCADGLYWYRYFGKGNKLFNMFIRIPEYIYEKQHPAFNLVRILPGVGDTASSVFSVQITIPGSNDTILARGTASFDVAWAQKLRDVLMGNETNFSGEKQPALSGEEGAELNCEQKLLANDVYAGKIEYYNYISKYKEDLLAAFRYHVMNQVREKLWIEYIDMRFGTTLYSYDRAGNLIQTVPPEGVRKIAATTATKIDSLRAANAIIPQAIPSHKKATIYEYNTVNRPWKEITPDAGTKLLYYDLKGNVLLSQSQRQRDDPSNFYTYFLYDGQNRLTETGQVSWNDSCPSFDPRPLYQFQQGQYIKTAKPFACACENLIDSVWEFCGPTNTQTYDHSQFVSMIRSLDRGQVVYTVYDSAFTPLETKRNLEAQENLRNRIGANMYYLAVGPGLPGSNFDHATHYSYDAAGNIKTLVQEFPQLESFKQRFKRIDYDYDLLSGKVNMISYNRGYADQFFQKYAYDADNRLLKAETSHDGFIWKRDAEYTYYQHGPLARVSLGDQRVQGIDYAYTLQGWLKSINGDLADSLSDMGGDGKRNTIVPRDAYATTLDYFTDDYKPIGNTPLSRLKPIGKSLYNGNIARQSTDVAPFGGLTTAYVYDQMNRLRRANYAQTKRDSVLQFNNWYASSYRYDMDGNLRNLMRKQGSGITMDSLRYTYHDSGIHNKVQDILDYAGTASSGAAALEDIRSGLGAGPGFPRLIYDGDGNMTNDFTGGIEEMKWNIYGKATQIDPMNYTGDLAKRGDLFFGYDALGHRTYKWQQQQVDSGNLYHHTFYVREASGNILAEYNMTKDVAFQDVVRVIRNTRGGALWGTWTSSIGNLGYTFDPAFSGYIISKGGPTSLFPIGYYLAGNPSMRNQFISGGFGALTAMCRYSLGSGKFPAADALRASINPNNAAGTITSISNAVFGNPDPTLRRRALVQVAQMVPDLYRTIVQQNQLTILTPADSTNLFNIMFNTAQNNLPYYANQLNLLRQQSPAILDNWLNTITSDSLYTTGQWYQQSGYISLLQNSLVNFGDQAANNIALAAGTDKRTEGLYGFASWWPSSLTVLNSMGYSSGSLAKVSYFNDPVTYLNGLSDYSIVDTALSLIGSLDFVGLAQYAGVPVSGGVYEEPEIKSQRISLGNHHMYGSSRIGISNYFPTQFRNFWDFRSGVVDTTLNIAMPWYSYAYNDLIDTGKVSPYGNSLSRSAVAQHLLGQKQYEIASQLGNVHAVLSDKRFVKRTPANVRDYFNASIVSAYDYYPYGQLMPGRYASDTTPVCVTSTQTRLMPKKTVTDVLPLATHIPAPGTIGNIGMGPSGKTVYGQGGGMNIEVPVTAGVPVNVIVNISYIHASFVTVEISEPAGSGRRILGSRNYSYPLSVTFPVTPSGSGIRVKMMMMSSFVSAPPAGLFAASVANYEKVSYEPQPVLVTLCNRSDDKYEFGFNGQMKMNEIAGIGNWNTAEFWEYATRSAHRANPDPIKDASLSPYAVFNGNPILNSDVKGDFPIAVPVAIIEGAALWEMAFGAAFIASTGAYVYSGIHGGYNHEYIYPRDNVLSPPRSYAVSAPKTITRPVVGVKTDEYVKEETKKQFYYVTYTITDLDGNVYVGRSSGNGNPQEIARRRVANHHMVKRKGYLEKSVVVTSSFPGLKGYFDRSEVGYQAVRASEDIQIRAMRNTGRSGNSINGIGDYNPNKDQYYDIFNKVVRDLDQPLGGFFGGGSSGGGSSNSNSGGAKPDFGSQGGMHGQKRK